MPPAGFTNDLKLIKEADLVRALAEQVGLEFVDLADYHIDPSSTMLLPDALGRQAVGDAQGLGMVPDAQVLEA